MSELTHSIHMRERIFYFILGSLVMAVVMVIGTLTAEYKKFQTTRSEATETTATMIFTDDKRYVYTVYMLKNCLLKLKEDQK